MLQLAWPWSLAAALLPLLTAMLPPARAGQTGALRVPFLQQIRHWPGYRETPRRRWRLYFAIVAWLALVLAGARPQWVGEPVNLPLTGRDLMLAIDLSNSMSEPDQLLGGSRVARLTAVKTVAGDFIERRAGDRLGLVLFGARPYLQVPLTFDRGIVRVLLEEAVIGLAGSSTAIGDAIGLAVKRLRERPAASRVLVLLTDGASNSGTLEPLQAAQLARAHRLRIYTIGIGALPSRPGPASDAHAPQALDLDEATLRGIAEITGGRYFPARNTRELVAIYALLDELEPLASGTEQLRPVTELFYLPLALATLLSAVVATCLMAGPGMFSNVFHRVTTSRTVLD